MNSIYRWFRIAWFGHEKVPQNPVGQSISAFPRLTRRL